MSKLLDDLRQEQRHYERSLHGEGRAENIKRMADHIEDLEDENKELREALDIDKVFLLHNYFRGVLSEENNDPIQRREDKDLFDFTLRLKQTLAQLNEKGEGK